MRAFLRGIFEKASAKLGFSLLRTSELGGLRDTNIKLRMLSSPLPERLGHVLHRLKCECVLDIGANRGQFHDMLRKEAGFEGLVVSYEPVPELVENLRDRSHQDRLWRIEACAMGHRAGTMHLNVMAANEFSSFLRPSSMQPSRFSTSNIVVREELVTVRTLDEEIARLVAREGVERFYVKLDTQGYDLVVLSGAQSCLSLIVGIQSEVSFVPIYDGMPSWITSLQEIHALGFELSGIVPVAMDTATCRIVEADCIFVRPEAISIGET